MIYTFIESVELIYAFLTCNIQLVSNSPSLFSCNISSNSVIDSISLKSAFSVVTSGGGNVENNSYSSGSNILFVFSYSFDNSLLGYLCLI